MLHSIVLTVTRAVTVNEVKQSQTQGSIFQIAQSPEATEKLKGRQHLTEYIAHQEMCLLPTFNGEFQKGYRNSSRATTFRALFQGTIFQNSKDSLNTIIQYC